jgi:hypothetical protein
MTLFLVPAAPELQAVLYDSMSSQILKMLNRGTVEQADICIWRASYPSHISVNQEYFKLSSRLSS